MGDNNFNNMSPTICATFALPAFVPGYGVYAWEYCYSNISELAIVIIKSANIATTGLNGKPKCGTSACFNVCRELFR